MALKPFSIDYLRCAKCETLVLARVTSGEELLVRDDERDLYGKHYFEKLSRQHGQPSLGDRARLDLPERCVHWLRTLLKYKTPPARVLELGSAHGGFVAMMRWAGFDAQGLDLSPEQVDAGRRRFDVPILVGPIEEQTIEPKSLDAIVMMDVLEHFANPVGTLRHCADLLKQDGIFLVQTPDYPEGKTLEQMQAEGDRFLIQLKPDQHVYLFSRSSIQSFFKDVGFGHINFEPAIFSFYDMAVVASAQPMREIPEAEALAGLECRPETRQMLALLDLDTRRREIWSRLDESEADRAARLTEANKLALKLEQVEADRAIRLDNVNKLEALLVASEKARAALHEEVVSLAQRLGEAEVNRSSQLESIRNLERWRQESETNHLARVDDVTKLSSRLREVDADRTARLRIIAELEARLRESEADRTTRLNDVAKLTAHLKDAEADRTARLGMVAELEVKLQESEADRATRLNDVAKLASQLKEADADRTARLGMVAELEVKLQESEADRATRLNDVTRLGSQLKDAEADRTARLGMIAELEARLKESEADRATRLNDVAKLAVQLKEADADRTARLGMIAELEARLKESEADRAARLQNVGKLAAQLEEVQADRIARVDNIHKLEEMICASESDRAEIREDALKLARRLHESEGSRAGLMQAVQSLEAKLQESETDRALRLERADELAKLLKEADVDRTDRLATVRTLQLQLAESESDRGARLEAIEVLGRALKESEIDREARLKSADELAKLLKEADADRTARLATVKTLQLQLADSESDRGARLEAIGILDRGLRESQANGVRQEAQIQRLEALRRRDKEFAERHKQEVLGLARALAESKAYLNLERTRTEQIELQLNELRRIYASTVEEHAKTAHHAQSQLEQRDARLRERDLQFSQQSWRLTNSEEALDRAMQLLSRVRQTAPFRALRKVGLWGWLDETEEPAPSSAEPSAPRELNRIVVDLTPVLPGGENGGAKVLTLELISQLSKLVPKSEFILLTSSKAHDELAWLDAKNVSRHCINHAKNMTRASDKIAVRARSALTGIVPLKTLEWIGSAYRATRETPFEPGEGLLRTLKADLLFCPFTGLHYFDPSVPTVSIVHDLQHIYYPQFFAPLEIYERQRDFTRVCRLASRIVCVSDYVRQTVLEKTTLQPENVETIHNLLPRRLPDVSEPVANRTLESLRLVSGRYLLYPANFWLHKNHDVLLTAFGMYRAGKPQSDLKLVLTGAPSQRREALIEASHRMGLGSCVVFPGYLKTDEFRAVLDSCMGIIFPSLFEGFGMPLLEAMAAGKPILCSNQTSLPEVAGDAAFLFDPRKPAEIARVIASLDGDPRLAEELARKSRERLLAFGDAPAMAASYWKAFQTAADQSCSIAEGVYGVFEDGWLGQRVMIVVASGPPKRQLVVRLTVPQWVPMQSITVRLRSAAGVPEQVCIQRGKTVTLRRTLAASPKPIEMILSPSFQPSAEGAGEDTRHLTCQCEAIEVVHADGQSIFLTRGGDDA